MHTRLVRLWHAQRPKAGVLLAKVTFCRDKEVSCKWRTGEAGGILFPVPIVKTSVGIVANRRTVEPDLARALRTRAGLTRSNLLRQMQYLGTIHAMKSAEINVKGGCQMAAVDKDLSVLSHIDRLVKEEEILYGKSELTEDDRHRLREV